MPAYDYSGASIFGYQPPKEKTRAEKETIQQMTERYAAMRGVDWRTMHERAMRKLRRSRGKRKDTRTLRIKGRWQDVTEFRPAAGNQVDM